MLLYIARDAARPVERRNACVPGIDGFRVAARMGVLAANFALFLAPPGVAALALLGVLR